MKAQFVGSFMGLGQLPKDGLPEVALVGRSNVGKSSLVNRLVQRTKLARTSNTPGRTQALNYYLIDDRFYFVDLPGYGFAKVSKGLREQWGRLIETYLLERASLALVLQVVDLRHEPTADDVAMFEWLAHYDKPRAVVATKADKLPRGRQVTNSQVARRTLRLFPSDPLVPFSATTGLGRDEVWQLINRHTKGQG